jgi:predicted adenylyl cyclase CyaB
MPRNIEIKARIDNVDSILPRVAQVADSGPIPITQDDTFFRCETGRLKLRTFPDGSGELIFYRRPDAGSPKESFYVRVPVPDPESLRDALTLAYGQAGRVRKERTLYHAGRTRIHLDRVEGLGHFLELEVVLSEDEPADAGILEAKGLMDRLGIAASQLIPGAYIDLVR